MSRETDQIVTEVMEVIDDKGKSLTKVDWQETLEDIVAGCESRLEAVREELAEDEGGSDEDDELP